MTRSCSVALCNVKLCRCHTAFFCPVFVAVVVVVSCHVMSFLNAVLRSVKSLLSFMLCCFMACLIKLFDVMLCHSLSPIISCHVI